MHPRHKSKPDIAASARLLHGTMPTLLNRGRRHSNRSDNDLIKQGHSKQHDSHQIQIWEHTQNFNLAPNVQILVEAALQREKLSADRAGSNSPHDIISEVRVNSSLIYPFLTPFYGQAAIAWPMHRHGSSFLATEDSQRSVSSKESIDQELKRTSSLQNVQIWGHTLGPVSWAIIAKEQ